MYLARTLAERSTARRLGARFGATRPRFLEVCNPFALRELARAIGCNLLGRTFRRLGSLLGDWKR